MSPMSSAPKPVGLLVGREYSFPLASSLLLSAIMTWLFYVLR